MKLDFRITLFYLIVIVSICCTSTTLLHGREIQKFENVRYVNTPNNTGDHFLVDVGGWHFWLTLCYIDCPAVAMNCRSDTLDVFEEQGYWGIRNSDSVIAYGENARGFLAQVLVNAFDIKVAPKGDTIYGYVQTAEGKDVACLLVENGYARVQHNEKISNIPEELADRYRLEKLRDLELTAVLRKAGIWAICDTDCLIELRAIQREINRKLDSSGVFIQVEKSHKNLINLNTASIEELQQVKGIGSVLAGRIISARPYKSIDDLRKVKGIGLKIYKKISPYFYVDSRR